MRAVECRLSTADDRFSRMDADAAEQNGISCHQLNTVHSRELGIEYCGFRLRQMLLAHVRERMAAYTFPITRYWLWLCPGPRENMCLPTYAYDCSLECLDTLL